ncbi:MAG: TolC family protein, partial [Flammeovirgaceae bacterium]
AKVKETVGLGLPEISGNVSLVHNAQLQRFFTTYTGNASGFLGDLSSVPNIKTGDIVAAQNFFQLKNSGTASVTVNQLLFSGSYLVGLQASKTYKDLSYKNANLTREQIVQQVTKAYYSLLISKERLLLFETSMVRVETLLNNTKEQNKNGFVESIDVDRIKVTFNNLKVEQANYLNIHELSSWLLKFQMNYPIDQPISIIGSIQDFGADLKAEVIDDSWDYKTRADYKILETNYKLQKLTIKNQHAGALPTLAAFGTLGYNTQSGDFGGLFSTDSRISDQGGLGPDKWYDYSLLGITMSVPIFSGFQRHHKIQQEKLNLTKVENSFKVLKQGIDLETRQTSVNFKNALNSLEAQKENMDLASNIARITKIKYEQGVGSNLEVVDAENAL